MTIIKSTKLERNYIVLLYLDASIPNGLMLISTYVIHLRH